MAVFLIGYDLNKGADYESLEAAIQDLGDWIHPLDSTWFVEMDDKTTVGSIVDSLKEHFTGKQALFVTKIKKPYQGLLDDDEWDWLNERVD